MHHASPITETFFQVSISYLLSRRPSSFRFDRSGGKTKCYFWGGLQQVVIGSRIIAEFDEVPS
jgi:hypothetical protein